MSKRIFRGGSWRSHAGYVRVAYHLGHSSDFRSGHLGFRLVVVEDEEEATPGAAARRTATEAPPQGIRPLVLPRRVFRGSSWSSYASDVRAAASDGFVPGILTVAFGDLGFRLVIEDEEEEA